ncbi:nucleoside hydrolase [Gemella sp.]
MKVIYDCDNTMGINYKDIDDGLTLLYLYKNPNVDLLGVSLTFGNDSLDRVIESTKALVSKFNIDVPVYFGNENEENFLENSAAKYIVEETKKYPNEITILATGSLKNIADAYLLDTKVFERIKNIVIMGGITEPLIINGKVMNELNLSVSHNSSFEVLSNVKSPVILTGNTCLESKLFLDEVKSIISSFIGYSIELYEECKQWIEYHSQDYNIDYIIIWDLLTAVYVTNPEIFEDEEHQVEINRDYLKSGYMKKVNYNDKKIIVPKLVDREKYIELVKSIYSL